MAVVTELVTKFSFKGNLQPLERYRENLKSAISKTAAFSAAATAAASVTQQLQSAKATMTQAEALGITTAELQKLKFAGTQVGITGQQMTSSLEGLSEAIGQAATQGSEEFARLGISVRNAAGEVKSTQTILKELQARVQQGNLSIQQVRSFSEALNVDPQVLVRLSETNKSLEQLKANAEGIPMLNADSESKINEFNKSMAKTKFAFNQLKNQIAISLAPAFSDLLDDFRQFINENSESMVKSIKNITSGIGTFASAVGDVISKLGGWKVALGAVGAALAFIAPVATLVISGISALVLVVEDVITYFEGGESQIGKFIEKLKKLYNMVADSPFGQFLSDINGQISSLVESFQQFSSIIVNQTISALKEVYGWLESIFGFLGDSGNGQSVTTGQKQNMGGRTVEPIKDDVVKSAIDFDKMPRNSATQNNNNVNIEKIEVNGNQNPTRTAEEIRRQIENPTQMVTDAQFESRKGGI
jgi:hypothetical protein